MSAQINFKKKFSKWNHAIREDIESPGELSYSYEKGRDAHGKLWIMHAPHDKHHKVSSFLKSHQNTQNSVKYEVI